MQESREWIKQFEQEERMSYTPPIEAIIRNVNSRFEDGVYRAVQNVGIRVDKAELEKALLYDRGQYEKGYADGESAAYDRVLDAMNELCTDEEKGIIFDVHMAYLYAVMLKKVLELKGGEPE